MQTIRRTINGAIFSREGNSTTKIDKIFVYFEAYLHFQILRG